MVPRLKKIRSSRCFVEQIRRHRQNVQPHAQIAKAATANSDGIRIPFDVSSKPTLQA